MLKRKKPEKAMVEGRRSTQLQSARPVTTQDPAVSGRQLMPLCWAALGRVVIFKPVENCSLCFWMCSGHTELGFPKIWSAIYRIGQYFAFCAICEIGRNVLIHRSNQWCHCHVETFCRCSRCIDCWWLVFHLSHLLQRSSTAPTCLFDSNDAAS